MKEKLMKVVQEIGPELDQMSLEMYENPETAYQEYLASRLHEDILEKYGFAVEKKLIGIDTGFKAVYDSGKPGLTVGFLSEYDALPGLGHGCGHNLLGAVGTGAGIAYKDIIDEIGGRVIVYGTPAEENNGAKMAYAKAGQFDELDLALMAHPQAAYKRCGDMLALAGVCFEFHGKPAHASACPEEGRNAMDALILAISAINALRQQMRSSSRVHGMIVKAGDAGNIIPDFASAQFMVRSKTRSYNDELIERVRDCARGAALATGTTVKFTDDPDVYLDNMITNHTLEELFCEKMEEAFGITVGGPLLENGSNDAGMLSKICPMIHPLFGICDGERYSVNTPPHSEEFRDATITPYAREQMRKTIVGLALTAAAAATDAELYRKIREEFETAER